MSLPPSVRQAVLEVVQRLRDPMREVDVTSVGFLVLDAMPLMVGSLQRYEVLNLIRLKLGLPLAPGALSTIAYWARGRSREEVAAALEHIATSEADER